MRPIQRAGAALQLVALQRQRTGARRSISDIIIRYVALAKTELARFICRINVHCRLETENTTDDK